MRFPLRLSAAILKTRISTLLAGSSASSLILHATPGEHGIAQAKSATAPIVWIGGEEPLLCPGIGRLANELVERDRHVFVHTDGNNLRQRIHEFRPDSRLFLTLEFAGRGQTQDHVGYHGALHRALEGLRAAKLSGFLVAAHFTVTAETDPCEIGELVESLDKQDVDGFIVSTGSRASSVQIHSLSETLQDALSMIRCGRWENFSRLLEASYHDSVTARVPEKLSSSGESAFEESD